MEVTLIPGDGVGPELIYAMEDIVENTGIPLVFEEIFLRYCRCFVSRRFRCSLHSYELLKIVCEVRIALSEVLGK